MALCRVLLKTFGPNDVLLLASLLRMDDESLEDYDDNDTKSRFPSAPDTGDDIVDGTMIRCDLLLRVESKNKVKIEIPVPLHLARPLAVLAPRYLRVRVTYQKTIPPEEGRNVYTLSLTCN